MVYNMVMLMVNIADIKAKLSEYLDRAVAGERVLICRHNKPIAELRAVADLRTDPRPIPDYCQVGRRSMSLQRSSNRCPKPSWSIGTALMPPIR